MTRGITGLLYAIGGALFLSVIGNVLLVMALVKETERGDGLQHRLNYAETNAPVACPCAECKCCPACHGQRPRE